MISIRHYRHRAGAEGYVRFIDIDRKLKTGCWAETIIGSRAPAKPAMLWHTHDEASSHRLASAGWHENIDEAPHGAPRKEMSERGERQRVASGRVVYCDVASDGEDECGARADLYLLRRIMTGGRLYRASPDTTTASKQLARLVAASESDITKAAGGDSSR